MIPLLVGAGVALAAGVILSKDDSEPASVKTSRREVSESHVAKYLTPEEMSRIDAGQPEPKGAR